jgi:hypothetical protein
MGGKIEWTAYMEDCVRIQLTIALPAQHLLLRLCCEPLRVRYIMAGRGFGWTFWDSFGYRDKGLQFLPFPRNSYILVSENALFSSNLQTINFNPTTPHPSLRHLLPRNLNLKRSKLRHNRFLPLLHHAAILQSISQHPQIIHIIRWRECIKELSLLVKRVTKGMDSFRGHDHVVTNFSVDYTFVSAEADAAFCHEKGLIVHSVPMEDWTGGFAGDGEGYGADSVVCVAPIFEDTDCGKALAHYELINLSSFLG